MSRRSNRILMTSLWCVVVALLAVGVIAVLGFVRGERLTAHLSNAEGRRVPAADLASENVPDGRNGAVVYREVFRRLSTPEAKADLYEVAPLVSPFARPADKEAWERAAKAIDRHREVFALVEKAVARPECRFPVKWAKGPEADQTHLENLRHISYLLCGAAVVDARNGRTDRALHFIDLAFRVGESLKDEPSLPSQMMRITIVDATARSFQSVARCGSVGGVEAARLQKTLEKIDLFRGFVRGLQGERWAGVRFFDDIRKGDSLDGEPIGAGANLGPADGLISRAADKVRQPVLRMDESVYLDCMQQQIQAAHMSYREAKAKGLLQVDRELPDYAVVTKALVRDNSAGLCARDTAAAHVIGTRVFLTLCLYKSRFGRYPSDLCELEARLRVRLPKDPFSGKEFIYKRSGSEFVLYSIGPDTQDDGGSSPRPESCIYDEGDIVWDSRTA